MDDFNKLREVVERQKSALAELEKEVNVVLNSDLTVENKALKDEILKLRDAAALCEMKLTVVTEKHNELKNALHEQIYSEKVRIINSAAKKKDIYFKSAIDSELNNLTQLEDDIRSKINQLLNNLRKHSIGATNELYEKLTAISESADAVFREVREKMMKETETFAKYSSAEFEKLKEEQVSEEVIESLGKKNNIETFIGSNLINKIGVIFVLLGIIALSRYTFTRLPDEFKGIIMFLISGGLLAGGEFLNRKNPNVFSLGLTAGGVAGLYISLSVSYFYLEIIGMYPAILLCVLITAGAFVLSQRYDSQTIAAFALFGGYIPIISVSESIALIYGAMVYFVALNLLALIISFYKKWKVSMFIGFFLNLAGTIFIVAQTGSFGDTYSSASKAITIFYVFFAFAIYTVIPIVNNLRAKTPFNKAEVVVLGLNTIFSAIIIYALFQDYGFKAYNGVMMIAFTLVYVALAKLIEKRLTDEKNTVALFYITGLTFAILTVPLQFDKAWFSLGWLAEGVALAAYGIIKDVKGFRRAGYVICALCLAAFFIYDLPYRDYHYGTLRLFPYKYLAITIGSIVILTANIFKKTLSGTGENAYKYIVAVNVWFYLLYLVSQTEQFLTGQIELYNIYFLMSAAYVTATFLYAFILPRVPRISDTGTKIISVVISILGMIYLFGVTGFSNLVTRGYGDIPAGATVMSVIILTALCVLAVLAMRSVVMFFIIRARLPVEWLPFGISAYFLVILTQNLVAQFELSVYSIIISIIYVVASFAWIVYGFLKRYGVMRRFGLGLSIVAVAKLFLIDLSYLTQWAKIVSYFAFGAALLGISFVYQYFGKRLTPREDATDDNEE